MNNAPAGMTAKIVRVLGPSKTGIEVDIAIYTNGLKIGNVFGYLKTYDSGTRVNAFRGETIRALPHLGDDDIAVVMRAVAALGS